MFERFTDKAIQAITLAQDEARRLKQPVVGTEQILLGILAEGSSVAAAVLQDANVTLDLARAEVEQIIRYGRDPLPVEIPFTPAVKHLLERSLQKVDQLNHTYVVPAHLLLALLDDQESVAINILNKLGLDLYQLRLAIVHSFGEAPVLAGVGNVRGSSSPTSDSTPAPKPGQVLQQFGTNLTQLAAEGKLDPVVGRHLEVERVIQILGRRTKNNPVLVGEPGVGKTAIAEGLAQRISQQDVPELLHDRQVISLNVGQLVAGTRFRGEFEERLTQLIQDVQQAGNIILVIDEIHTLVGAGAIEGGMDASNLLKPALARGELQCIGATTLDEYRKYIERDAALERRFQQVMVSEPSVEDTIAILQGVRERYEQHHQLTISNAALEAAAHLSDRYISDRYLPDKAIDLMDEASSRVRLRQAQQSGTKELRKNLHKVKQDKATAVEIQDFEQASQLRDQELELEAKLNAILSGTHTNQLASETPSVTAEDIAQVLEAWTGIPVNRLSEAESAALLYLEARLHERVIGQAEAVTAVAKAIRRSRLGLKDPDRPIASLFFAGPTGVGKTELAKALAVSLFGSEDAMIRLDMSEYMERYTVSKLIGSPPGYVGYGEGGQLTEAVRRRPYTLVLLDEMEKAHPDVFNLLLQVLEDGHLTDAQGRTVSFKNTLLIMTSNIGSQMTEMKSGSFGFDLSGQTAERSRGLQARSLVQMVMKQAFRPEFINRLDEIIVFDPLTQTQIMQIADILLQRVSHRLEDRDIHLELTDAFKDHLVAAGYDPTYGARPLRRAISHLVEDRLAEAMLQGQIQAGDIAIFDLDEEGRVLVRSKETPVLAEAI